MLLNFLLSPCKQYFKPFLPLHHASFSPTGGRLFNMINSRWVLFILVIMSLFPSPPRLILSCPRNLWAIEVACPVLGYQVSAGKRRLIFPVPHPLYQFPWHLLGYLSTSLVPTACIPAMKPLVWCSRALQVHPSHTLSFLQKQNKNQNKTLRLFFFNLFL